MYGAQQPAEIASQPVALARRQPLETLRQVVTAEAALPTAFQALARYQDELARTAADLREREVCALTVILTISSPIWQNPSRPIMRFMPDRPGDPHLELGTFSHLKDLFAPSADEQVLIAATQPCWARVWPHEERRLAGGTGPHGCSYVAITVDEAIAAIGFERILSQIEAAVCATGQTLLVQTLSQRKQHARLLATERMLGWEPDPREGSLDPVMPTGAHSLLVLLARGGAAGWAVCAVFVVLLMLVACLLPV
jgi:hypothetical protein